MWLTLLSIKRIRKGIKARNEAGDKQGIKQGRDNGIKEVARKMKDMGLDLQQIIAATGLSREEIYRL